MKKLFSGLLLMTLTACSQAGLFLANLPVRFNEVRVVRDISYGAGPLQKLDLYLPAQIGPQPAPVLVFAYGGRWQSGSRADYAFVGDRFAKLGYIVVIPDYRKYPEVRFPAFVEDLAAATAWAYAHIGEYGGNNTRLLLSGHSAGAQMAALVAADKRYLAAHQLDAYEIVKGFAGLAGPYDFTPEAADVKAIFPPESYHDMKVTSFINGQQPPMLLLHGEADDVVEPYNYERLAARIRSTGGHVEVKTYPQLDHIWIAASLTWFASSKAPVAEDMADFFARVGEE